MLDFFSADNMLPHTFALSLMVGLFLLELLLLLLGVSLSGGADGPDLDLDMDSGLDLDPGMEGSEILDALSLESSADVDVNLDAAGSSVGSLAAWLGFGKVPFVIWLNAVLLGFGLTGLAIQAASLSILGFMLPVWVVSPVAALVAAGFAGTFSKAFSVLLPKVETESVSERSLHRRRGVVVVGTAKRGSPAEVRIKDRFGNLHYPLLEPFSDQDEIPEGSRVLVIRNLRERVMRIIQISE